MNPSNIHIAKMKFIKGLLIMALLSTSQILAQKVDPDASIGKKKIEPLQNYASRLLYKPQLEPVKIYFKEMRFEETGTNNKVMTLKVFKRSELKYEFLDFDLSGKFETIKEYKEGKLLAENKLFEDSEIISEKTIFNEKSQVAEVLNDLKKQGFFSERNIYENGKIVKTLKDLNGDGLFEQEFIYFLKNRPVENVFSLDLNDKKNPLNAYCIFGGFYQQDKYTMFDESASNQIAQSLSGILFGGFDKTKNIAGHIFKEENKKKELGKKFVTKLDIYQAVEQIEGLKEESNSQKRYFILSGKIYKTPQRVSVYFRVNGPDALGTIFSANFISPADRYNVNDMIKAVKAKMQEYFMPVTNEKGNQEGIRLKNVNP